MPILSPMAPQAMVQPAFFDRVIYSLYRAAGEKWGQEVWDIVWKAGEILLDEIAREHAIQGETPLGTLQNLARYLVDVGYVDHLDITPLSPTRLRYRMGRPVILEGARRLIEAHLPPPHISTALMFAALRRFHGLKAEMVGDPRFLPDGTAVEIWELRPATQGGER